MKASDERDLVYAVVGLIETSGSPIIPDYTKRPDRVLCEAAAFNIRTAGDLDALTFTASDLDSELPSWIPSAAQSKQGLFLCAAIDCYKAAGSTRPRLRWTCDYKGMSAMGLLIDIVARVAVEDRRDTLYESKLLAYATGQLHGLRRRDTKERFWRTIIANQGRSFDSTRSTYPAPADFGRRYMISQTETEELPEAASEDILQWYRNYGEPFKASVDAFNNHQQSNFFTTSSGRFGLGQSGVAPGDMLCILFGGRVVYILRDFGAYQKLVGCAYVHGVMDGELSSQLNDERLVREFEIH